MSTRPILRLRPKKSAKRFRFGDPWVFADEVVLDRRTKALEPGVIATLEDEHRDEVATVTINPNSKIIGRVLDLDSSAAIDASWIAKRLTRALVIRERIFAAPYYRLVHAEADGLPGVIIDRFGDALVVQPNAAWADVQFEALKAALEEVVPHSILIRNGTGRARKLEGLSDELVIETGAVNDAIPVPMNGATYFADLTGGQKTGLFFDQRDNHAFAATLANGQAVLDVFSHVGGFGLASLAGGATQATCLDSSKAALDLAARGAEASGFADQFSCLNGDAFKVMGELVSAGESYGMVVSDPPAFAPTKQALDAGLRAYERAARAAADLVEPGGYLVLCSCSHAATMPKFAEASFRGIGKAGRKARILRNGQASADHPVHPNLAESGYLKSIFLALD